MGKPSFESLDDFLDADEFATLGTFGTNPTTRQVRGIHDKEFVTVDAGTPGMEAVAPSFLMAEADLAGTPVIEHATACVIEGINYTVKNLQPDGVGMTRLILKDMTP